MYSRPLMKFFLNKPEIYNNKPTELVNISNKIDTKDKTNPK
jgi:hypothetical protein